MENKSHFLKVCIFSLPLLLYSFYGIAQVSEGGTPMSFEQENKKLLPVLTTGGINLRSVFAQDSIEAEKGIAPRFGYTIKADIDFLEQGLWEELPNGYKICRLQIKSENANAISLMYDDFWLPPGARLFIYNPGKTQIIGAFTSRNNKKSRKFATSIIYGDELILEYSIPSDAAEIGSIHISHVVHVYQNFRAIFDANRGFEDSGDCQVDVNCPEGAQWQDEKKGVAMIAVDDSQNEAVRICSGSLINNTAQNCDSLFLTANHCLWGWDEKLDAGNESNLDTWLFYWNYEWPEGTCQTSLLEPPPLISTAGATILANDFPSDFALFRLSESPQTAGYDVYFNGWSRTDSPGKGGVGIHHPKGDVKKISTHSMIPKSEDLASWGFNPGYPEYWAVKWDETLNGHGVTEGGSSGSPLFDKNTKLIIGQLKGVDVSCGSQYDNSCCDFVDILQSGYGKIGYSWNNGNNPSEKRRLSDWLDPLGLDLESIGGTYQPACGSNDLYAIIGSIKKPTCASNCDGEIALQVTGGTPPYNYFWSDPGIGNSPLAVNLCGKSTYSVTVTDSENHSFSIDKITIGNPPALEVDITGGGILPQLCSPGAGSHFLSAEIKGGMPPYTSSWPNNQISIANTGFYPIHVTDANGCRASAWTGVILIPVICSSDPNDIVGPEGYAEPRWVSVHDNLPYTIRFENDPDFATAPAQKVVIEHVPDEDLNLFSTRLGDFGFANHFFEVPPNTTFYSKRLDLTDSLGVYVDVTAGVDVTADKIFWIFESIDPATGLPPTDATMGLLPVNDSLLMNGEGFVNFTIKPKSSSVTGDLVPAEAAIVFDENEAIRTNIWENVVDAGAPSSEIDPLPATINSNSISLSWTAIDDPGGSGVDFVDLFVKKDEGNFYLYQSGLTGNAIQFTGQMGSTYCFYTRATDHVGNVEPHKLTCEQTISMQEASANYEITILDPCHCLDNATTLSNGQFSESIQVTGPAGETWTVANVSGLFQVTSPPPPASPVPIVLGTTLPEDPPGFYTLSGLHIDAQGYILQVTNGTDTLGISNACYYPNPSLSGLSSEYCTLDGPQTVVVTAELGDGSDQAPVETIHFELIRANDNSLVSIQSGASNTFQFNPASLQNGQHILRVTFNSDIGGPVHPGCVQTIEESFLVRKVGCGTYPWDGN